MSNLKSRSRLRPFRISIIVAASVGAGFWIGYMDGASLEAVLRSGLILASVMTVFFAAGTLWQSLRQNGENDGKDR